MVNKKTTNNRDESKTDINHAASSKIKDDLPNQKETKPANSHSQKKQNIIVQVIQPKTNQPRIANIIAGIAAFISLCLGVITYSLFLKSSTQTQAALRADTIAYRSYKSSDSINKVNAAFNKRIFDETKSYNKANSIDAAKKNRRDSLSFRAQIAALGETQKEFEIENRPLVQIANIRFDSLKVGSLIIVDWDFINMGRQPVKCVQNVAGLEFSFSKEFDKKRIPYDTKKSSDYLSGNSTYRSFLRTGTPCQKSDYDNIKAGKIYTFISGSLKFENTVTSKKSTYNYLYRLSYIGEQFNADGVIDTIISK